METQLEMIQRICRAHSLSALCADGTWRIAARQTRGDKTFKREVASFGTTNEMLAFLIGVDLQHKILSEEPSPGAITVSDLLTKGGM